MAEETIAAISTAPGEGALAVVRISGPRAPEILMSIFRPSQTGGTIETHRLYPGAVADPADGHEVDQVMAVRMDAPRTYTRENMAEIYCHGGSLVSGLILNACIAAGARPAEPGEFTRRAFMNGRIDLTQAEAVIRMIRARSEESLRGAVDQLEGNLKREIGEIREDVSSLLMEVEAGIDFPEDTSGEIASRKRIGIYDNIINKTNCLMRRIRWGNVVSSGISVVLAGPPNAGKSTLLNTLLNRERAIVTPMAGTTRDAVAEDVQINGMLFTLTDTAGLGGVGSDIEKLMENKTREYIGQADLVVVVLDRQDRNADIAAILRDLKNRKYIIAWNKADLNVSDAMKNVTAVNQEVPAVSISALNGEGIDELRDAIFEAGRAAVDASVKHDAVFVEEEQKEALKRAAKLLEECREAEKVNRGDEVYAELLRQTLGQIGEFTGETVSEAILDRIFSKFCIGK